jgi:hypothetical protein
MLDLPTATEPATPITKGVGWARSPRKSLVTRWSCLVPPTYRFSSRLSGR